MQAIGTVHRQAGVPAPVEDDELACLAGGEDAVPLEALQPVIELQSHSLRHQRLCFQP